MSAHERGAAARAAGVQENRTRTTHRARLYERLHHHGVSGGTHLHLGETRESGESRWKR